MSNQMKAIGRRKRTRSALAAGVLASALLLSACGGGVGSNGGGGDAGGGEGDGFEWGADQETVDQAIDGLEPITINYQSGSPSPNSLVAHPALQFKEYIEERSNGQIAVELHWSGSIASYNEVDDALMDGRLDVAYTIPTYFVSEYPVYDALAKLSHYGPDTPLAGEAATMAMMTDLAYGNEDFLSEFTDKGLRVLTPSISTGTYGTWCTEAQEDGLAGWNGYTISVPNTSANAIVQALGGSPVSLEYGETFDGLQRNTIQCTTATPASASAGGIVEVAPHLTFPTEGGITRTASANVAGSSFENFPLAYQQIIFDADTAASDGFMRAIQDTTVDNAEVSADAGGSFRPFEAESQKLIDETQQEIVDGAVESGNISQDEVDRAQEAAEHWMSAAGENGLVDGGTLADFDEWYNAEDFDFTPFMEQVFEEVLLPHRPGA